METQYSTEHVYHDPTHSLIWVQLDPPFITHDTALITTVQVFVLLSWKEANCLLHVVVVELLSFV